MGRGALAAGETLVPIVRVSASNSTQPWPSNWWRREGLSCFLTQEELKLLKERALEEKLAPHAYYGKYRDLSAKERVGEEKPGKSMLFALKIPGKNTLLQTW